MTHNNNPSGVEELLIPRNTESPMADIADAYIYGELGENSTTPENNNINMDITTDNPNEYYQLQASQNSSSNSNQLDQYSTDSVHNHSNDTIK